ncbi:MAG: divalent-cation tolerance protein CutA [Thermoplasmata archaeon]|nr:divalent-cation tolerance protein CutA [Thermoplasmata archaeon]
MSGPPLDSSAEERRLRLVYVAAANRQEARRLGEGAVERRLAACASYWPIRSVYWWKGAMERSPEQAVLLKTSGKKLGALFRFLVREHSYEVPDILELKVPRAHEPYIRWLLESIDPETALVAAPARARRPAGPRARAGQGLRRTRAPRPRPY